MTVTSFASRTSEPSYLASSVSRYNGPMPGGDGEREVPEPTTPAERPPYWSDCESMDLPQLRRFIHDALLRRVEPNVPDDGSTPLTRQEFMDLVSLMQTNADELTQDTTEPERPVYDGPAAPPAIPDATELRAAARRRRDQAQQRLADAIRYKAGRNLIQQRREEVREAERAIPSQKRRGRAGSRRSSSSTASTGRPASATSAASRPGNER
jgi:hypothetical protein